MTREQQVEAFTDDVHKLVMRYLDEFDLYVEDMVYVLESQAMMMMVEAVRAALDEEEDNEEWSTPTA